MEKKISQLENNTNLTSDDILVTVDNSTTSTKKSTIAEVVQAGLPQNIPANVSIRSKINSQLSTSVLPIGELAYELDTNCLRIGDGSSNGGVIPTPTFYKLRQIGVYTRSSTQVLPDSELSIELRNMPGIFHVKSLCMFTGVNPPKVSLLLNENALCVNPGYVLVQRLAINSDDPSDALNGTLTVLDEKKSIICPNSTYSTVFDAWTYYTAQQGVFGYLVEMECYVSCNTNLESTMSVGWGCAIDGTEVSITSGSIVASKVG